MALRHTQNPQESAPSPHAKLFVARVLAAKTKEDRSAETRISGFILGTVGTHIETF